MNMSLDVTALTEVHTLTPSNRQMKDTVILESKTDNVSFLSWLWLDMSLSERDKGEKYAKVKALETHLYHRCDLQMACCVVKGYVGMACAYEPKMIRRVGTGWRRSAMKARRINLLKDQSLLVMIWIPKQTQTVIYFLSLV